MYRPTDHNKKITVTGRGRNERICISGHGSAIVRRYWAGNNLEVMRLIWAEAEDTPLFV